MKRQAPLGYDWHQGVQAGSSKWHDKNARHLGACRPYGQQLPGVGISQWIIPLKARDQSSRYLVILSTLITLCVIVILIIEYCIVLEWPSIVGFPGTCGSCTNEFEVQCSQ